MAEDSIAQGRLLRAVARAGTLNDVTNFDVRRAGHFAAFAVDAVFQRIVVQRTVFQAQTFTVRPGLFRTRVARVYAANRADRGADGAFNTAFKSGVVHCSASMRWIICSATWSAVTAQTPPPQP